MRRAALRVLALVASVMSGSCHRPPHQIADASPDVAGVEAAPDLPPDAAACGCHVDDSDTLLLSWACYCQLPFVGCDVPLAVAADCPSRMRTDYADCGLTVVTENSGASAGLPTVYDDSGTLVGRASRLETGVYQCPSDPGVWGSTISAGVFPGSACQGVSCGGCYAGPFPCPGDGGGP
jgi:hypothetical protein